MQATQSDGITPTILSWEARLSDSRRTCVACRAVDLRWPRSCYGLLGMNRSSAVFLGVPVIAAVGVFTLAGHDGVRASPDSPLGSPRVGVSAGRFMMGSDTGAADERPVHAVSGSAFTMDRYEVTNQRYSECVQSGACSPPALLSSFTRPSYFSERQFADFPVVHVSWGQAASFCAWAGGRLPTEAEWERAARGTADSRTFPWGETAPDCSKANFAGCVGDTDRVGRRPAGQSPYGVFDMAGNVWEWTADWYEAGYYGRSPENDPAGPDSGHLKVMRGGCWVSGTSSLRSTCRKAELPGLWAPNVGFRCVYPSAGE